MKLARCAKPSHMKISYSDDALRGAGYGILTCREADFPKGAYAMALRRASDQGYLAPGGNGTLWVGETRFLPVETQSLPDGGLTVLLGPETVNALDPLEQYLVTLKPEQGNLLNARLQVQGITYSRDNALQNTGLRVQEAAKPAAERNAPAPEPVAEPVPAAPDDIPPAAAESAPLAMQPEESQPAAKGRRVSPVLLVALAAALLAGALGTWKFFDGKAQEEKAALTPQSSAPQAPAPAPATSLPATPKTAEEQVRAFFSGPDITATAALNLAAQLPKTTPAEQDAVYRLYYYAAANDAPAAFMPYGRCLDPVEPAWGSIDKDAAAAFAAYAKAAASDAKVAKAALDAQTRLRSWLDSQAASGNAKARAWLQELP